MELFQALGAKVEQLWRDKNYDETLFPALAAEALEAANLPQKLSAWEVIEWTLSQTVLPDQRDPSGRFGDPPITLYNSPRFHVDVYFWLEGTTAIHQHSFCGAFQVMHGSSIHSHRIRAARKIECFYRNRRDEFENRRISRSRKSAANRGGQTIYSRAFSS